MQYPQRPLGQAVRLACSALILGSTMPALAASDGEVQALRALVERLQQEISEIKQTQRAQAQQPQTAAPAAVSAASTSAPAAGNLLPAGLKIYGSLDSGVEQVTHVGSARSTLSRVPSTSGSGPSTLGFDFRHPVGDSGIAAVAKAEMGLYLDTGSSGQGSRIFGRQLYAGVDSAAGSLTVGRQYSMLYYSLMGADILGPNIHGLGSIDAYIPNARADNAVVWRARFFDGLSLGAHYSFGRETVSGTVPASGVCAGEDATGTTRCRSWSAMAKYDQPTYGLAVAVDTQHGGTGAQASFFNGASAIAMTTASDEDRRITANGYARFGAFKLGLGWLGRKVDTTSIEVKQNTTWLQGEYSFTDAWLLDGGFFHVSNNQQDRHANMYVLRGTYRFDHQLSAYLSLGRMENSATAGYGISGGGSGAAPAVGSAQTGTMVGMRYRF